MREGYKERANDFLAAKKLQGEAEVMIFYRTLIIRLLVVFFLVNLSSMAFLMLLRELVLGITGGVYEWPLVASFGLISGVFAFALYYFLREDVFLARFVRKVQRLKKTAPSTYGFKASDSTTT